MLSVLYDKSKVNVKIEKFLLKEKERFFNIKNLKITKAGDLKFDDANSTKSFFNWNSCQECIKTNYKLVIEGESKSSHELQEIQGIVELAFKIIIGCNFPFQKFESKDFMNGSLGQDHKIFTSKRNKKIINKKVIDRLKKLIDILVKENSKKKIELFKFFLNSAMTSQVGLSGALYISILESIFLLNNNPEITYRFSMRFTKFKKENLEYRNKIKDLYGKRSKMFHSGKNKFSEEELKFLEEEACSAIESYLLDSEFFTDENLDNLLIN